MKALLVSFIAVLISISCNDVPDDNEKKPPPKEEDPKKFSLEVEITGLEDMNKGNGAPARISDADIIKMELYKNTEKIKGNLSDIVLKNSVQFQIKCKIKSSKKDADLRIYASKDKNTGLQALFFGEANQTADTSAEISTTPSKKVSNDDSIKKINVVTPSNFKTGGKTLDLDIYIEDIKNKEKYTIKLKLKGKS